MSITQLAHSGAEAETPHGPAHLAGRIAAAILLAIVVLGTIAAWFGVLVLGGLVFATTQRESAEWPSIVIFLGIGAALTFLMAVIWRSRTSSTWLAAILITLGVLVAFGLMYAIPATSDSFGSIGALVPIAWCVLAGLTSVNVLFRRRAAWLAGLLAVAAELAVTGVWVAVVALAH